MSHFRLLRTAADRRLRGGQHHQEHRLRFAHLHQRGGCNCNGTAHQAGGLGVLSPAPSTSNMSSTSGSVLTLSGDIGDTTYSYAPPVAPP